MKHILILAAAILTIGCAQEKEAQLGPEDTLKAFYKDLCQGEFKEAKNLCDTLSMKEYITAVQQTWSKNSESVQTILPAIMSETETEITEVVKNGQDRTIFYKLTTTDGQNKEKIATLRKEEGAWRVETITEAD